MKKNDLINLYYQLLKMDMVKEHHILTIELQIEVVMGIINISYISRNGQMYLHHFLYLRR